MADANPLYGVLCIALGSLALHDQEDALKIAAMAREALASRPAEVDDKGLPELPELPPESARASKGQGAFFMKWSETGKDLRGELLLFTAEQFRQGQRDAVAADRARRGSIDRQLTEDPPQSNKEQCLLCAANFGRGCWAHKRPSHTTNKEKG